MKRTTIVCIVSVLAMLMSDCLVAQNAGKPLATGKPQPLRIGDDCPDFLFNNLMNHPKKEFRLSSLKGKWVILDFWSRGCRDCIPLLKEAQQLEKKFNQQVVIIPITMDKRETVESYFTKVKPLQGHKVFTVAGDTTLWFYFPHRGVPHEVWISPQGTVAAITGGSEVNEDNIRKVIATGVASFKEKREFLYFNGDSLLLHAGEKPIEWRSSCIGYSSLLTHYKSGIRSRSMAPARQIGNQIKILAANASIDQIYQMAFGSRWKPQILEHNPDFHFFQPARTILEVKDSSIFNWPGRRYSDFEDIPDSAKYFSYELIIPLKDSLKLRSYMQADLNRIFGDSHGIEGVKERRKVSCWALTRIKDCKIEPSKGEVSNISFDEDASKIEVKNCTATKFLFYWVSFHLFRSPIPIIDETGYFAPMDFTLKVNPNDLQAVSKALEPYGLQFQQVERDLDMVIIRDKK